MDIKSDTADTQTSKDGTRSLWLDRPIGREGDFVGSARWLLGMAVELVENFEECDHDFEERARDVFERPAEKTVTARSGREITCPVTISEDELNAVKEVVAVAFSHWVTNNYATDDGTPEDILAGKFAEHHSDKHGSPDWAALAFRFNNFADFAAL